MSRALLVSGVIAVLAPCTPCPAQVDGGERGTIEDRLEGLRSARAETLAALGPQVAAQLDALAAARVSRDAREIERATERLVGLGPGVGVVLCTHLDPGVDSDVTRLRRAEAALDVVSELELAAALPDLRVLAVEGSALGRLHALRALGAASEREVTVPFLLSRSRLAEPVEERCAALASLARLGGAPAEERLAEALADEQEPVRTAALEALARERIEGFGTRLLDLLAPGSGTTEHWPQVLDYFAVFPDDFDTAAARRVLSLVPRRAVSTEHAIALLDRVGDLPLDRRDLEDELTELKNLEDNLVSEAGLILATRLGDKSARRVLEERYDFWVERAREREFQPYVNRAQLFLRLREYDAAVRDYREALDVADDRPVSVRRPLFIGLARAYAREERLDRASKALEEAQLPEQLRDQLAGDPVFAELLAHPRHGEVLRP